MTERSLVCVFCESAIEGGEALWAMHPVEVEGYWADPVDVEGIPLSFHDICLTAARRDDPAWEQVTTE